MPRDEDEISIELAETAKKIRKFDEEMPESLENLGTAPLKHRVLQSQANLLDNERARKDDRKLESAKQRYGDLKAPYDDAKKFQSAIVSYGMLLLEQRGVGLAEEDE